MAYLNYCSSLTASTLTPSSQFVLIATSSPSVCLPNIGDTQNSVLFTSFLIVAPFLNEHIQQLFSGISLG